MELPLFCWDFLYIFCIKERSEHILDLRANREHVLAVQAVLAC